MIEEKVNLEKGLLEVKWIGDCSHDVIGEYLRGLKKHREQFSQLKVITILEGARVVPSIDADYLKWLATLVADVVSVYDRVTDAFVVDSTRAVAFSTMYESMCLIPNYYFKVFSTEEAAIAFLESH